MCMREKEKCAGRMSGNAGVLPDCEVIHNRHWSVFLGRPYHGMPQEGSVFFSTQQVGRTPWYSTDATFGVQSSLFLLKSSTALLFSSIRHAKLSCR